MMAPASFSFFTTVASCSGKVPASARFPPAEATSFTSTVSLTAMGIPWSGLRRPLSDPLAVELARDFERARVHGQDRVQLRSVLVVGLDPAQIHLDQPLVGESAGVDRGLDVVDARGQEVERARRGRSRGRETKKQREEKHRSRSHGRGLYRKGAESTIPSPCGGFFSRSSRLRIRRPRRGKRALSPSLRRVSRGRRGGRPRAESRGRGLLSRGHGRRFVANHSERNHRNGDAGIRRIGASDLAAGRLHSLSQSSGEALRASREIRCAASVSSAGATVSPATASGAREASRVPT